MNGAKYRADLPKYLYGIVALLNARFDEALMELELTFLYAERYKQSVRYEGVVYFDQKLREAGLYIGMAEELPLSALLEASFGEALQRFCSAAGRREEYIEELSARGGRLFVNHGRADDYIVVAKNVEVEDVGA